MGWVGGGLCDYCVSPSPFGLDFGTLDFGLGLDNYMHDNGCKIKPHLKLSDLALPGLGTSLALTRCRAPQLHWTNLQAPAT